MFHSARLTLTAWYVLIIMMISGLFSVTIYQLSTQDIQRLIDRVEHQEEESGYTVFRQGPPPLPFTVDELEEVKDRFLLNLIFLNGFILLIAGGASYFLAGRTLRPIEEMVEEQKQFVSSASHELRTPIATMRAEMEASLLEKKIPEVQARKLIKSNLEELSHLQSLANNLLTLVQTNKKNIHHTVTTIDISQVAEKAITSIKPLAKKKSIAITSVLQSQRILGEEQRLKELFVIILDNAIKYSPEKTAITISLTSSKKTVSITIADQGRGISKKDVSRIFDRFYRADASRNEEGYGLGLSIAKQIIDAHAGTIVVKNNKPNGTIFIVNFPLAK